MTQATAEPPPKTNEANWDYIKLVVRRLYDAQKLRIQSDLRLQRLVREELILKEEAERVFGRAKEFEEKAEAEYERIIWREVKGLRIVEEWLGRIRGVGPRISGLLLANIAPIDRFPNVAKLWAYAGLHVVDGKAAKRAKGEKANWNAELKTTCWKLAGSFIKAGGENGYRGIYDRYKARITERELAKGNIIWKTSEKGGKAVPALLPEGVEAPDDVPDLGAREHPYPLRRLSEQKKPVPAKLPEAAEWTLGRIHNMAMRYSAKLFLSHLWHVWREIEGLPTVGPYALEYLKHTTYIDPWEMVEP